MLARKGITMPATALAGVLLSHVTTPPPTALAAVIAASTGATAAGTASALAKGVIAMMKLKFAGGVLVAVLILAGVAVPLVMLQGAANAPAPTTQRGEASAAPELQQIIDSIKTAERSLNNLRIEGNQTVERWDNAAKKWILQNENQVVAYYTGQPNSKVRVDYKMAKSEWMNGPSPFYVEKKSLAYNGKLGMRLFSGVNDTTGTVDPRRGMLLAGRPQEIENGVVAAQTGWNLSLFGIAETSSMRLSRMFEVLSIDTKLVSLLCESL
jgi:hypothetical protein